MRVITDSNSYLRLARELHPLLGRDFGIIPYILKIHKDFENEYKANSRLQNKFHWVNEPEYLQNRMAHSIKFNNKYDGNRIIDLIPYINGFKKVNRLSISNIDIFILAGAKVLDIPILTDDPDMLITADEFEIVAIKCISFLSYLNDHSHIDETSLAKIFGYWEAIGDCPKNYHLDLQTTFPTVSALLGNNN